MNYVETRSKFVNYFENQGFKCLPRASMLHPSIPMSFVMSAGLVQIETSLNQNQIRFNDKYILVQDCFRHFDLENVGKDDLHLSLFEMSGAFIFGHHKKEQTINQIWQLTTEVYGIDKNRIWVTYFAGGKLGKHQLPSDELTRQTWLNIGISDKNLIGLGLDDNYWLQGVGGYTNDNMPRKCGPNTELFYDRGNGCGKHCQPGCNCGRFIEFSNTLFISHAFNPQNQSLRLLSKPFVETVVGSERLTMILQNKSSVFDIDDYKTIINTISMFKKPQGLSEKAIKTSERIIADYLKALFVLIADGAPPPGKGGRKRMMRILIRSFLSRQYILRIQSRKFLPTIIDSIVNSLDNKYVESSEIKNRMIAYIEDEELRFKQTLAKGQHEIESMIEQNKGETLTGSQILFLEKKLGLPNILTALILKEKGYVFNEIAYQKYLTSWQIKNTN
ncbi:MAG: hypothetical protein KDH98_11110 [Calditrichaeota bacterium]|nr:hypothetical protein [Calditrichota bacterium]